MPSKRSSLYPLFPKGTQILIPAPESSKLTTSDRILVYSSSLLIVGSFFWIPIYSIHLYKKWKQIPKQNIRKRRIYATVLLSIAFLVVTGPYRSKKVGEWLQVRKWKLWRAWMKFIAFEVVTDVDYSQFLRRHWSKSKSSSNGDSNTNSNGGIYSTLDSIGNATLRVEGDRGDRGGRGISSKQSFDVIKDQSITALIPHGLIPFSVGFAALPEVAQKAFGVFRPVVATATAFFPYVNTLLNWVNKVDASRSAVNKALRNKARIGVSPGGISEMFEGYPKPPNTHPNDECALLKRRKGFIRMAIQHQIPVIPVYCFGATNMLRRLNLPLLERISKVLRISLCLFYGQYGLPIPFRQRLLYVMGKPIFPPALLGVGEGMGGEETNNGDEEALRKQVDDMHEVFCDELIRIFDKYKESYGWDDKRLQLT